MGGDTYEPTPPQPIQFQGARMSVVDADLVLLSRTVDARELGKRLRRARVLAGLTQAQVAGDDVTAAYVSRIEDGQRRPEFTLLQRMVRRLGTTIEDLLADGAVPPAVELELQLAADHAELALASGDARAALAQAAALRSRLQESGPTDLVRRVAQLRASAHEALGDLNEAIVLLEELVSEPTADARWLSDLIGLSRCYRETGDLARAIAVGERTAETIAQLGLDGLPEAIQLTVTVAGAQMLCGDLDLAMRTCMRAIEAAEANQSPVARASAYWNASLIETRNGAHAAALLLARKALAAFETSEDARSMARLRTQLAKMQLRTDPPDPAGALETLELAGRDLTWSSSSTIDRASEHLTRARALLLLAEFEAAQAAVTDALALLPEAAVVSRASAQALEGQIAAACGDVDLACMRFQSAVQTLTGAGADREAAQLWFELGSLLTELGQTEQALDAFRRAGASTGLSASASAIRTTA